MMIRTLHTPSRGTVARAGQTPGRIRARVTSAVGTLAVSALALSACTAGTDGGGGTTAAPADDEEVSISIWSGFSDRELGIIDDAVARFEADHPNYTVTSQGSQDDDKLAQAIRGGNAPDVAVSFSTDYVGQNCSSGAWQDLGPFIERDGVDLEQIPAAVRGYTEFEGTRCALPMLADVYGLYYNLDQFAAAGLTEPPRTTSELLETAKKLTQFNEDGSIKVAGFVPLMNFYANTPQVVGPMFGAHWTDDSGRSSISTDPAWAALATWQKELVDWYGYDTLQKFVAGSGQQYSADQDFQTGRIAMALDGEYRTAFIDDAAPDLNYATAPVPVSDDRVEEYGGGYATGTVIGIPQGAENPGAAFELIKYLAFDTGSLVAMSNGLKNVPTTLDALESTELEVTPQFQTFLDVFASDGLSNNPPSANGGAYLKTVSDFFDTWQAGGVKDLDAALAQVDTDIENAKGIGG
ncbi:extracellular solute-binding protein [Oerskovia paurometabola]